jgi:hypothetical protein
MSDEAFQLLDSFYHFTSVHWPFKMIPILSGLALLAVSTLVYCVLFVGRRDKRLPPGRLTMMRCVTDEVANCPRPANVAYYRELAPDSY